MKTLGLTDMVSAALEREAERHHVASCQAHAKGDDVLRVTEESRRDHLNQLAQSMRQKYSDVTAEKRWIIVSRATESAIKFSSDDGSSEVITFPTALCAAFFMLDHHFNPEHFYWREA